MLLAFVFVVTPYSVNAAYGEPSFLSEKIASVVSSIKKQIVGGDDLEYVDKYERVFDYWDWVAVKKIRLFFKSKEDIGVYMPAEKYAEDFVYYAKMYGLEGDKKYLVAAIAFNESAGFQKKFMCGNNGFGWSVYSSKKCKDPFVSIEHAIDVVSWNLAGKNPDTEKYYKDKSLEEIIETYNPSYKNSKYLKNVLKTIDDMKNM